MASSAPLKVVYRKVGEITPYARNARTHSDEQIAQIAGSIKEWGFTNPILIDETDTIIAGHGRLAAAMRLQMDEVPTIVLAGLTDAQKRAYVIADNKLALNAGWDLEMLKFEFIELEHENFPLELTGFSIGDIAEIVSPSDPDGGGEGEGEGDDNYVEQYAVIVICRDAGHQERVFNELQDKGFECRVVNT